MWIPYKSSIVVVTVVYDTRESDLENIGSFTRQLGTADAICVVNNGPSDDILPALGNICRIHHSGTSLVIPYQEGRGYGAACNRAVSSAPMSSLILLVNSDASLATGLVSELRAVFALNPKLGIATPQLCDYQQRPTISGAVFPSIAGFVTEKWSWFFGARNHDALSKVRKKLSYVPMDWVSGAVMMIRRDVWDTIGGFDPRFYLYYEDVDLCRRARAAGWDVGIVAGANAIHEGGGSQWRPGTRTRVERIYFESQAYYFRKHYGRLMERLLRAVRFPYIATSMRRWFLQRHGVRIPVVAAPD